MIHNMEQRSNAWHSIRLGRFTGTRMGSLLSAKSTAKYQDAIFDVVSEIITSDYSEIRVTEDMQNGIDTEPLARNEYECLFGVDVKEVGFITPENEFSDWIGISPDGLINGNGLLEIKCPKAKTHLGYIKSNKMPTIYYPQVQSQLYVSGREWCDFMSFVENMKPFIVRVHPDAEFFALLEKELRIAIDMVKATLDYYEKYNYLNEN